MTAAEAPAVSPEAHLAGPWSFLRRGENLLLALTMGALLLLPLLDALLRLLKTGIPGGTSYVQHLVLITGMLGAAMAARDGRLLSISNLTGGLTPAARFKITQFSHGFAAAITTVLAVASWRFMMTEKAGGKLLALGIPVWVAQLILPAGFALLTVRLVWLASSRPGGRLVTAGIGGLLLAVALLLPIDPSVMVLPALIVLLAATLAGAPIFIVLGGAALILLWGIGVPAATVPLRHYSLTTNATLATLPLFTMAGYFLAEGGASRRLVRLFQALFGHLRGGPAFATVMVCAFFTSFTGASGVTILALGGLLLPVLLSSGYRDRDALGLLTGAGSLGLLLPPSLPLIVYSVVASVVATNLGVSVSIGIEEMFLAGILPGILRILMAGGLGILQGPRRPKETHRFDPREAWGAVVEAKWELGLPVVAMVALFSGIATPVEAAAITAAYALIIEVFVHGDLDLKADVPRILAECGLVIGGVLMILGLAMGFTHFMVMEQIPDRAVDWVQQTIRSPWLFLLALNFFLLIVGCLMDVFSALVVVVPLIVPMGIAYGIDPLHLGVVFLANLELGYLTPPVGMNLFFSSYRFERPVGEIIRSTLPFLLVSAIGVLLITYLPWLSTWLPSLVR